MKVVRERGATLTVLPSCVSGAGAKTTEEEADQISAEALIFGENLRFQASAATQAALVYRSVD